jgi:hypothetical protein
VMANATFEKELENVMKISRFSVGRNSWCEMAIIACKHGCLLLTEITQMTLRGIMLLRVLFWKSWEMLQLCLQRYMKSIGKSLLFSLYFQSTFNFHYWSPKFADFDH